MYYNMIINSYSPPPKKNPCKTNWIFFIILTVDYIMYPNIWPGKKTLKNNVMGVHLQEGGKRSNIPKVYTCT